MAILNQCPFLSTLEEKVQCFNECPFYEFECNGEGCPFKKAKGNKAFSIKEILSFDADDEIEEFDSEEFDSEYSFSEDFTEEYT